MIYGLCPWLAGVSRRPSLFFLLLAFLSLSPLSTSFSVFVSVLSLFLPHLLSKVQDNDTVFLGCESELRNGNHSNSSCPAQPAHCCLRLSAQHCASHASEIILGVVCVACVCVYVCAYSGSGGGRGNRQMSLFAFFSLSSHQSQCSLRLSKYCSNHINILCTSAFRAAVQRAHEVISGSLQ